MKGLAVSVLVPFAWLLTFGQPLLAAPQPPLSVVNHATKECATIMGGDECMDCYPLEGWEVVSRGSGERCPTGYTEVHNIGAECIPMKDRFCCSEGHSGVHGDCEDLVLHEKGEQCAFVDDIHGAVLPEGWEQRPDDLHGYLWSCPSGYEWVADLEAVPSEEPTPVKESGPSPEVDGKETGSGGGGLPCPGAALIGPGVLGLVMIVSRGRKSRGHSPRD